MSCSLLGRATVPSQAADQRAAGILFCLAHAGEYFEAEPLTRVKYVRGSLGLEGVPSACRAQKRPIACGNDHWPCRGRTFGPASRLFLAR